MAGSISPQKSRQPDWIILYETYNVHEAHIVAGRLKSEGIPVMVYQEPGASAMGITVGRLGEVKVLVHPKDYDAGVAVLFPKEPDALEDDTRRIVFNDDEESLGDE